MILINKIAEVWKKKIHNAKKAELMNTFVSKYKYSIFNLIDQSLRKSHIFRNYSDKGDQDTFYPTSAQIKFFARLNFY